MATALMAWFRAPAPTTWISADPRVRTTPARAPATELGLDLLDTLRTSITLATPQRLPRAVPGTNCGNPQPPTLRPCSQRSPRAIPIPADRWRNRRNRRTGQAGRDRSHSPRPARPIGSVVEAYGVVVFGVGTQRDVLPAAQADPLTDLLGDLDHHLEVVGQETLGVLPALAQLLALVGVPGSGLLDDAQLDRHVYERPFPADALAVHDVELGLLERRADLVLHHLDPGAVTHHLGPVLDGLDAADVEAD